MNRNETLRNLLIAAGAAIEAALSFCEEDGEKQRPCQHQEERRKNLSTMGWERWQCLDCGHVHETKVDPGEGVDS